jgi:hypothetical protein
MHSKVKISQSIKKSSVLKDHGYFIATNVEATRILDSDDDHDLLQDRLEKREGLYSIFEKDTLLTSSIMLGDLERYDH